MKEFFAMGGYAFYIWSSYAIAFVVLLWNILQPLRLHKQTLQRLKRRLSLKRESP